MKLHTVVVMLISPHTLLMSLMWKKRMWSYKAIPACLKCVNNALRKRTAFFLPYTELACSLLVTSDLLPFGNLFVSSNIQSIYLDLCPLPPTELPDCTVLFKCECRCDHLALIQGAALTALLSMAAATWQN